MAYNPPGVSVIEYTNPVVSPLLSTSDTLCLVGPTSGGIVKTDAITFTPSELLSSSGWTANTGWTLSSGSTYAHSSGTGTLTHSFAPTTSTIYQVTYTLSGVTSGQITTIAFGGVTLPATTAQLSTNGTYTFTITSSSTATLAVTPATGFVGNISLSIKNSGVTNAFTLPSIPSGGQLQAITSAVLAESAPSGKTAGTHYEPFTATASLTSGSATFSVPANNSPWAVGQTVAAITSTLAASTVTNVASGTNNDVIVTLSNTATATAASATLVVNGTSATPDHYSIVKTAPVSTTLATAILSSGSAPTTIDLTSATGFPTTGSITIDNEVFAYTGVSGNQLTGVTVAQNSTTRAAHAVGTAASLFTNTIARTSTATSAIVSGDTVYVTYTYTPSDYYKVVQLDTMSDVEDRFGSSYNSDGSIASPLSFAAQIAFENGADSLLLQPLFVYNTDNVTRIQPTSGVGDTTAWENTFKALQSTPNINIIVPIIGTGMVLPGSSSTSTSGAPATLTNVKAVHDRLKTHIVTMLNDNEEYIIGVVGHDSSLSGAILSSDIISYANDLRINHQSQGYDQQMVMVSATKLQRPVSVSRTNVALKVGGQYAATAVAAMSVSRQVSTSLTRKNLSGFSAVLDVRTKKEKNNEAGAGIMVIEQVNGFTQIRHALTMDNVGGVSRSELSVVRAKHYMMSTLKTTVDDQLIGNVVADGNAPLIISTTISSALETLKNNNDIVDYSDVQARTLTVNPTVVDVRFNYRPAFPVNYINIGFSIDLSTGNSTLTQANTLQVG